MNITINGRNVYGVYYCKRSSEKRMISQRRIQTLCTQNKIENVKKLGWAWAIPQNASKPVVGRIKKKIVEEG
jgi:hypothetical protein